MVENFTSYNNITAGILSRNVRHDNFVTDIKNPACEMVQLMPYSERCKYVMETKECHEDIFIIDYADFYYCTLAPEKIYMIAFSIILLFLLCLMVFVFLGTATDVFFCPSLKVLSKIMKLSENLAGVTLLAFGNCAPDLFTAIVGLQAEAREAFNDTIASCIFVQLLVTSAIIISKPFRLTPSSFLRDILFLILACVFLDYAIKSHNTITLTEAIIIFLMYVTYIVVICMDQYLLLRAARERVSTDTNFARSESRLRALRSEAQIEFISRPGHRPSIAFESQINLKEKRDFKTSNRGLFKQFIKSLFVIDMNDWASAKIIIRILMVLRFPITFVLTVIVPIVDVDADLNGWSKLLNMLQLAFLPPLVIYGFTRETGIPILGIPLAVWLFAVTIPLACSLFIISRTDRPPVFHKYMSILAVFGSVFCVYGGASELIQILKVIGYITHRSNSFLGCTLLAWGNSVGDLIANTAMARQGYAKMGFAACFGGPLFNTLLTLGIIFTYRAATSEDLSFKTGTGTLGENSNIFLIFGMVVFLLGAVTLNFEMRRSLAVFPATIYGLYLVYCIMAEFEVLHPYGTDHRMDQKAEPADF